MSAALVLPHGGRAAIGAAIVSLDSPGGRRCQTFVWRARHLRGTILFSHGALSAPHKYRALIDPWVTAGFDVWAPLHVDSTDYPDTVKFPGLASWRARLEDMRAVAEHVGARHYIAAGHSYGALVALTLGGAQAATPVGWAGPLADPNVRASVAFSPPGPAMGLIDAAGYAALRVPALIQTGTADVPPGALSTEAWRTHLAAYEAAPANGNRYALVLDKTDHYFGGLICRPELPGPKQVAQFDIAVARSLAFLRGFGLDDAKARRVLGSQALSGAVTLPGFYRR